jgi:3-isopropylmalate/(R)-2-methylmalate dehydratase large subunit
MGSTMAQKVLARAAGKDDVEVGEIVSARVDRAMSHENAKLVSKVFRELGVKEVWDPDRIVLLFDHRIPANNIKTATAHKDVRTFVAEMDMPNFLEEREGICHQVMVELGFVAPGDLVVGTDSHTTTYGALGAFSTGIGATEMAGVWATGELWLRVPRTIRVEVHGGFRKRVGPKDLVLRFIGDVGADGADYAAIEWSGSAVESMEVPGRMTICNMSMEAGAKAGTVAPDDRTIEYLRGRVDPPYDHLVYPDSDCVYAAEHHYSASELEPMVAAPHTVDNVKPVREVEGLEIDQAVLGSCTNGRVADLQAAADVMGGERVAKGVRLLVIPASRRELLAAMKLGLIEQFVRAGAIVLNPGCGPCLGAHQGIMAAGERAIASTNRNFRGRMGSPDSEVYLASPETVAASALTGVITDPRGMV